jgi:hypothetical protein
MPVIQPSPEALAAVLKDCPNIDFERLLVDALSSPSEYGLAPEVVELLRRARRILQLRSPN